MKALSPRRHVAPVRTRTGWLDGLEGHRYVLLSTRRKDGSTVQTPVWFAADHDTVYVRTGARSGKVKRIRNDPRIAVAPCTIRGKPLGDAVDAVAHVMPEQDWAQPTRLLFRKYAVVLRLYGLLRRKRLAETVIVQIRPPV